MGHFSADAPITDDVVGRYFAVDEPSEYIPRTTARRWYLIDSVTKNADGTKDIRIIRHWWGAKAMNSPRLYNLENSSYDGHIKPLKYIIAPGANVYDVSDAVDSPKRTLRLAPTPFTGTAVDFAAGDPIEQAVGPDAHVGQEDLAGRRGLLAHLAHGLRLDESLHPRVEDEGEDLRLGWQQHRPVKDVECVGVGADGSWCDEHEASREARRGSRRRTVDGGCDG